MTKYLFMLLPLLMYAACSKDDEANLPPCLKSGLADGSINARYQITRYDTRIGRVYTLPGGDFEDVVDKNCTSLCALGGFAGNTICVVGTDTLDANMDFKNPVVVWKE